MRVSEESRPLQVDEALRQPLRESLEALIHALEAKDLHTRFHSVRVARRAGALAAHLAPDNPPFVERVRLAALFHDIGKLGLPEALLNKPGALTSGEAQYIRSHVEMGVTLLEPLLDAETIAMVRSHHEFWNGEGYPAGLAGEAIPLGARIVSVADAYDAMASHRPYRSALSPRQIERILREGAGVQWDPAVVAALRELVRDEKPDEPVGFLAFRRAA